MKFYLKRFGVQPLARLYYRVKLLRTERDSVACATRTSRRLRALEKLRGTAHAAVPLMSKSDYKDAPHAYRGVSGLLGNQISSSGTTGSPVTVRQSAMAVIREEAFVQRQLAWAGIRSMDRRVWLRSDVVVPATTKAAPFWRRSRLLRTLFMSSYHISSETVAGYLDEIAGFGARAMFAYPSAVIALARHGQAIGYVGRFPMLEAVVTSSEVFDAEDRKLVAEFFGCKVFDWYGQAERVAAIGTCGKGTYHLMTDYGIAEFGAPDQEGWCELIGTSLNNTATWLWRYRTGDFVRLSEAPCGCGSHFPVIADIKGRRDKVLTLGDGRQVVGCLNQVPKDICGLIELQIAQVQPDAFELRAVAGSGFSESERARLLARFHERIGDVTASIVEVDSIPRGRNGKFDFVRVETQGAPA